MDALPIDVIGNIILKFLSIKDFDQFALVSKYYHKLTNDLYFYHIKPRIVADSIVIPIKVETILSGEQLWKLYLMFHQVTFANEHNHWFQITLDFDGTNGNKKHIINPLLWYRRNIEINRNYPLFKHTNSYYTGIGLYSHLSFQIKAIPNNICYGKIDLSYMPSTIDTIAINMNYQQNIIYYFSNNENEYDEKHNDAFTEEKEVYEIQNDNKIYLWKNIFIGGGQFIKSSLDLSNTKHVKLMDEKLINGFDELIHKMNYKCIHLLFNNNKLKIIKNFDKLHRYIGNLQITQQWDWNESLKNINLSNYKRLTKINLSGNNLQGNINDFAGCLPKCLKMLNMNHNKGINGFLDFKILFHDNNLNEIEQIVITNCNLNGLKNFNMYLPKSLKVLCLNYNNIEVNWNVEFELTDVLKTASLERLSLCNNKINGNIDFQQMEQWMPYNLYLIDLNNNNLNGIVNLNHFPNSMEEFDISDNNIQQIIGLHLIQQNPDRFAGFTYDLDVQYGQ